MITQEMTGHPIYMTELSGTKKKRLGNLALWQETVHKTLLSSSVLFHPSLPLYSTRSYRSPLTQPSLNWPPKCPMLFIHSIKHTEWHPLDLLGGCPPGCLCTSVPTSWVVWPPKANCVCYQTSLCQIYLLLQLYNLILWKTTEMWEWLWFS